MSRMVKDVTAFHDYMGQPVRGKPSWPTRERIGLRISLVDEEINKELFPAIAKRDLVYTADAIADSIYVLIGMALEFGIPIDRIWKRIHAANMLKGIGVHDDDCGVRVGDRNIERRCTCGAVKYREDGKVLKPADFKAPDASIRLLLIDSGMTVEELDDLPRCECGKFEKCTQKMASCGLPDIQT